VLESAADESPPAAGSRWRPRQDRRRARGGRPPTR